MNYHSKHLDLSNNFNGHDFAVEFSVRMNQTKDNKQNISSTTTCETVLFDKSSTSKKSLRNVPMFETRCSLCE